MKNQNITFRTILLALGLLALCPTAQAVVPAPDGGYPGGNTAEGQNALLSLNVTTGTNNTAVGWFALKSNVGGQYNTAVGSGTLFNNTAYRNTAVGGAAMFSNTDGYSNTAVGALALLHTTTGFFNTAIGDHALVDNINGAGNTAAGGGALDSNTSGYLNTAIGSSAGGLQTTGSRNVYIGANMSGVAGESDACYIRSIYGQTSANGTPVFINSSHKLGTATSSRRFKEDIKPMGEASEALFLFKPVTFHYKKEIDPIGTSQFGLVAEEVEKVSRDLVVRDKDGKPYSVRYDQVNAMLLNEFLKEHRENEEQKKRISQLRSGMTALAATVKEQAAQIQKVSAQLAAASPSRGGLEASEFAIGRIRRGGSPLQVVNNP